MLQNQNIVFVVVRSDSRFESRSASAFSERSNSSRATIGSSGSQQRGYSPLRRAGPRDVTNGRRAGFGYPARAGSCDVIHGSRAGSSYPLRAGSCDVTINSSSVRPRRAGSCDVMNSSGGGGPSLMNLLVNCRQRDWSEVATASDYGRRVASKRAGSDSVEDIRSGLQPVEEEDSLTPVR
jgi:hypothetical protein